MHQNSLKYFTVCFTVSDSRTVEVEIFEISMKHYKPPDFLKSNTNQLSIRGNKYLLGSKK